MFGGSLYVNVMLYGLEMSDEKFSAQLICRTKRELNTEQEPSSPDQLSGTFGQ